MINTNYIFAKGDNNDTTMKFTVDYNKNIPDIRLVYEKEDYSIETLPVINSSDFTIEINYLNLTVINRQVHQIWGCFPVSKDMQCNLQIPPHRKGVLKVIDELEKGFTYDITHDNKFSVFVDFAKKCLCVGKLFSDDIRISVEFMTNCIISLNKYNEFEALWLMPEDLPIL
ncbi:MAG: hypothetical protein IJ759_02195 [Bacteroidales bacterium]|nr:hypothetical protein [Bacteroidales bacterium]